MHWIDAVDGFKDHAPRRWVRWALILLLVFVAVTGNTAPVRWYVTEEARVVQARWMPVFQEIVRQAATPAPAPSAK